MARGGEAAERQLVRVSGALAELAALLRANGERNFAELIEDMQQRAAASVVDEEEGRERLLDLTAQYDGMRANPYGIDSVFFGYPTVAETKAATAQLEMLRVVVARALHGQL